MISLIVLTAFFTFDRIKTLIKADILNKTTTAYQQGFQAGVNNWSNSVVQNLQKGVVPFIYNNTIQGVRIVGNCSLQPIKNANT